MCCCCVFILILAPSLDIHGPFRPGTVLLQSSRVTIKISDRNKMDRSTNEREVSISGTYGSVKLAEAMIAEKLNQARARAATREADGSAIDEEAA